MTNSSPYLHVSVVSHGQGELVNRLLHDLETCENPDILMVTVTQNIPEEIVLNPEDYPFPLEVIVNREIKGFGANHNAAFRRSSVCASREYFCVLNPDVRLTGNPWRLMLQRFQDTPDLGIVGPRVLNAAGRVESSAREIPTPLILLKKLLRFKERNLNSGALECVFPDWIAGICMVFPTRVYKALGGFDERYFLYYEDVDICCRAWLGGYRVALAAGSVITHEARFQSHRDLRYLRWHLNSAARFFLSRGFWRFTRHQPIDKRLKK